MGKGRCDGWASKGFLPFLSFFSLFLGVTAVEQKAELAMPISVPCDGKTLLAFSVQVDEELVGHEVTPKKQEYEAQ